VPAVSGHVLAGRLANPAPIGPAAVEVPGGDPREIVFHRPALYPRQEAAIYDEARISVIEATTKSGKTSGCGVWLVEQAYGGKPGWQYWWVAPTQNVAKIAYRRIKRGLPPGSFTANENEVSITLRDVETTMTFKGADRPDLLYGEDVHAGVIDECSRCKEEAFVALRSTVTATGGKLRLIGNKKGRRNWFFRMARKAEAREDPSMAYHKLTSQDAIAAGIFPLSEYLEAKRVMPPMIFAMLYDCEDGEDEGNPFGLQAIAACLVPARSAKPPVVWGWDLGKAVDFTVGIGLDEDGVEAAFERFQKRPWPETKAVIVARTAGLPALVDSTGLGDVVLDDLQHSGEGNFEGFVFTPKTKQQLMEGLAGDVQGRLVRYTEGPVSLELESFEYAYTATGVHYSAPEGYHDDCVCALALARHKQRSYSAPGIGVLDRRELNLFRTRGRHMAL
jgi:hypothetical protein